MRPKLSVVVPILGYESIGTFMETLQGAWADTLEVILLDSSKFGERHDSVNYDSTGRFTLVRAILDPPPSFHEILNMGLRMARGEYICLTNDDVLFGYKSLHHCVQAIDKFDLPCVYPMNTSGPAQLERFVPEGRKAAEMPLELIPGTDRPGNAGIGFCQVFAEDIFNITGYFDEQFEMFYGDRDLWYRLIDTGYPPRCVGNALIHHFEARTINIVRNRPDNTRDFDAIKKADQKLFKQKWGKTNAKTLLRQLKSEGEGPTYSEVRRGSRRET